MEGRPVEKACRTLHNLEELGSCEALAAAPEARKRDKAAVSFATLLARNADFEPPMVRTPRKPSKLAEPKNLYCHHEHVGARGTESDTGDISTIILVRLQCAEGLNIKAILATLC